MKKSRNLTIVVNNQAERLIRHLPKGKASPIFNQLLIESVRGGLIYDLLVSHGEIESAKAIREEWDAISREVGQLKEAIEVLPQARPAPQAATSATTPQNQAPQPTRHPDAAPEVGKEEAENTKAPFRLKI